MLSRIPHLFMPVDSSVTCSGSPPNLQKLPNVLWGVGNRLCVRALSSSGHRLNVCTIGLFYFFVLVTRFMTFPVILYLDFSNSGKLADATVSLDSDLPCYYPRKEKEGLLLILTCTKKWSGDDSAWCLGSWRGRWSDSMVKSEAVECHLGFSLAPG